MDWAIVWVLDGPRLNPGLDLMFVVPRALPAKF